MRVDGVVEAHQRLRLIFADLELHGQDGHAGARYGVNVVDAREARQHLFGRACDQRFDIPGGCAGKGHQHIGHGDINLGFFLARGDQHREDAQQQGDQRDQRGHRMTLESGGDAA